jgi:hypothetical protein
MAHVGQGWVVSGGEERIEQAVVGERVRIT